MFFLLRTAFWVTVILAVLPVFITHDDLRAPNAASKFSAGDAVNAATAAVSDLSQFCTRRPEACEAGMQAAAALGASAQNGVKILYGYLQHKATDQESATTRDATASIRKAAPAPSNSRNTLSTSDLAPRWRGPDSAGNSGA